MAIGSVKALSEVSAYGSIRGLIWWSLRTIRPLIMLCARITIALGIIGAFLEAALRGDVDAAIAFTIYMFLGASVFFGYDEVIRTLQPERNRFLNHTE